MSAEEAYNAVVETRRAANPPRSQASFQKVSDVNKCLYDIGVYWTTVRIDTDAVRTESVYSKWIWEIDGKSSDINHGFGGDYVYLTFDRAPDNYDQKAQVSYDIIFYTSKNPVPGKDDIARGADGLFRYLGAMTGGQLLKGDRVIIDAGLWRPAHHYKSPPSGWDGITPDLNQGRHGDYLYLIWKCGTWDGEEYRR